MLEIFEDTLLDGIIDMTSEDLTDSPLPVEEGDIVIDCLNPLEMRVHTSMSWTSSDIYEIAEEYGVSTDKIEELFDLCQNGSAEDIAAFSLSDMSSPDLENDPEDWIEIFDLIYKLISLKEFLRNLIEFRIENLEGIPFIVKENFSIVRIDKKTYRDDIMFFN